MPVLDRALTGRGVPTAARPAAVARIAPRVLFVSHTGNLGGAEFVLLDVVPEFAGRGGAVLFADGELRQRLEARGLSTHVPRNGSSFASIKRDRSLLRALPEVGGLMRQAAALAWRARRYDVLYANSQKAAVLAAVAGRIARRPMVWHLHDILDTGHFGRGQMRLAVMLANRCARCVIVPSEAAERAFVAAGGRAELVSVVPNGVDRDDRGAADPGCSARRAALGLGEAFTFGVFSRLSRWKGQDVAIRALSLLPEAHCVVAGAALFGEDDFAEELRALARQLGVEGRLHFLGHRDDVQDVMRAMDAVVHPSILPEPFGRTLVEAMLSRVPVVATAAGAAPEILADGEAGLLVPTNDSGAIAAALRRLAADPALAARLVAAGERRARSSYGTERMQRGIAGVVAAAVAQSRPAAMEVRP